MTHSASTPATYGTVMLTALIRLHDSLKQVRLPLDLPGMDAHRDAQREMVDQLEDYVIPRVTTLEAPLLAVVGGSTGAGKSTLVNSLVGEKVTMPGRAAPDHPLPGARAPPGRRLVVRAGPAAARPRAGVVLDQRPGAPSSWCRATPCPQGLAILDAPDVDSVEERNRELAAQLLAAADLWIFVTSAARYADQVPWDFLRQAAERSTAVAIVLDRTPEEAVQTVSTHLAQDAGQPRAQGLAALRGP